MFETINTRNWLMYAIKHYDNNKANGENDFEDDLKRFKYLKRLFRKYQSNEILKTRLILNHIIILQNMFKVTPACTLLFFKIEKEFWSYLKTFLVYLNYMERNELPSVPIDIKVLELIEKDIKDE